MFTLCDILYHLIMCSLYVVCVRYSEAKLVTNSRSRKSLVARLVLDFVICSVV
jgi:hypothetical protein